MIGQFLLLLNNQLLLGDSLTIIRYVTRVGSRCSWGKTPVNWVGNCNTTSKSGLSQPLYSDSGSGCDGRKSDASVNSEQMIKEKLKKKQSPPVCKIIVLSDDDEEDENQNAPMAKETDENPKIRYGIVQVHVKKGGPSRCRCSNAGVILVPLLQNSKSGRQVRVKEMQNFSQTLFANV